MIEIQGLEVFCRIGVPEEERSSEQRLLLDVVMEPAVPMAELADDIEQTVDYHAVSLGLTALARSRSRKLIETLAWDSANWILAHHPVRWVSVRVRKFILPQTEWVSATVRASTDG